ncbi:hypothetical protein [Metabacillus niabensis]|uniref:hypothetical protein n=1 Tax=Metabacillus niabensis TaxID=324854 RepID=UPI0039A09976
MSKKRIWVRTILFGIVLASIITTYFFIQNNESNKVAVNDINIEEEKIKAQPKRELTEEDKKFISLLEDGQYTTLFEETKEFETQSQRDFNNLALSYLEYGKSNYKSSLGYLDRVEYIPEELEEKITRFKEILKLEKDKEVEQEILEEQNRMIDDATENPSSVTIGMTKEEVLTKGWGKPEDINRTVTKYGTSEQWIYSNYNYLYFEDGILTSIQTN